MTALRVCFAQPAALPRWPASWPVHEDGSPVTAPFIAYFCDGELIVPPSLDLTPLFDGTQKVLVPLLDGVWRNETGERPYTVWLQRVTCPECTCALALARCHAPGGNSAQDRQELATLVCDSETPGTGKVT